MSGPETTTFPNRAEVNQMRNTRPAATCRRVLLACVSLAVLCLGLAANATAALPIQSFEGYAWNSEGKPDDQAAGHPFEAATEFHFPLAPFGPSPSDDAPAEDLKTTVVSLPRGFVGNPTAVPKCELGRSLQFSLSTACPANTQVGIATVHTAGLPPGLPITALAPAPIYNMEPPPGVAARFGFRVLFPDVVIDAVIRPGDYTVQARAENISQALALRGTKITLWGVPASPAHDSERLGTGCDDIKIGTPCAAGVPEKAFLTNPSDCAAGPLPTTIEVDTWQDQGSFTTASFDHDPNGAPMAVAACERVPFEPELTALPTSHRADSPTGLAVKLRMPQFGLEDPRGIGAAPLKKAVVTLPEGMSVNPSSATGLGACSMEQLGIAANGVADGEPVSCPDSAKIGSLTGTTPLLDEGLTGSIYLAEQNRNPFGSLLALYLVVENPTRGILVKLAGRVDADPRTGRLTATFDDNPQLPVEDLELRFKSGPRAPLITPARCGTYTTRVSLTSWAGQRSESSSSFRIDEGPDAGPCPDGGFKPAFAAGTLSPIAGEYAPLLVKGSRPDGSQVVKGLTFALPAGLTGRLAGIPYCPDAALAAAAARSGGAEQASPSCPGASRIGTVDVGAGAGATPFQVRGSVYLAGPYRGAPLSAAVVTPAVAGPFDLGTVVVRARLQVDPTTARITAVSDSIPHILQGIPLAIRGVEVRADKPEFTLNPTSCKPQLTSGTVTGLLDSAQLSSYFQVGACRALDFRPRLAMRFSGAPTRRSGHPKLTATLRMPEGGANIERAVVTMPKTEFLENAHIRTICTRVQWAAKTCPKAAIYGYAKAWTPLLDEPLQGPVYLRSSDNELPDLVADLDGQIEIDLVGRIDSVNERIRNTFLTVPDAPVSKFQLTMQGGRKGLLVNNTNLCKARPRANAKFTGQNGRVRRVKPRVKVAGCGKNRKKRAAKHKR